MSRLISYVLADRQSARKRVVIAVRFERDADIDLISVQDRDEQCVAIPCAAKTILILGGARALPPPPPANGLGEPSPRRLPHSSGRCSHYEPPDHLALCRSASSNVLDGYAAYKEAVCRQNSRETVCLSADSDRRALLQTLPRPGGICCVERGSGICCIGGKGHAARRLRPAQAARPKICCTKARCAGMSPLGTARTCPLASIAIASMPASVRFAVQKP